MKVYKRNGAEQDFCIDKIKNAVDKANKSVPEDQRIPDEQCEKVINTVLTMLKGFETIKVEDIQDIVEKALMKHNKYAVAKSYILYRDEKRKNRKFNSIEEQAISLMEGTNEELRGDNANKHVDVASSQRDYLAGLVCKSYFKKTAPKELVRFHEKGLGHFHDSDYSPLMPLFNCDLLNIEEMFGPKGFQMGDTHINSPKTFSNACNLLAQISLIVSGSQYGGQTISWAHVVPFVQKTRDYYTVMYDKVLDKIPGFFRWFVKLILRPFKKTIIKTFTDIDVTKGIKTYTFQIICHQSSNGQTPFVSNNLSLREANPEELDDMAMIIKKLLKRRIKGVQDSNLNWVGPLFPKFLYWLCEGLNVEPTDPYYSLTKLAAKCNSVRCQPDINSEKKSREIKHGQIIPSMGCLSGDTKILVNCGGQQLNTTFADFWKTMEFAEGSKPQFNIDGNPNLEIDLTNISIWDNKLEKFVNCEKVIRNKSESWYEIELTNGTDTIKLNATDDHVWTTENKGDCHTDKLTVGDEILVGKTNVKAYKISKLKNYKKSDYSYDVTTESAHFMANNTYSHNCRSWLSASWEEKSYPINTKFYWQEIDETNVQYEGALRPNVNYKKGLIYSDLPTDPDTIKNIAINFRGNTGWPLRVENDRIVILKPIVYGRFNSGVVTVSIPHAAGTAKVEYEAKMEEYNKAKDEGIQMEKPNLMEIFYKTLDSYFQIARTGLIYRTDRVKKIKAKNIPIHLMYGAIDRMDENDTIADWINKHPTLMSTSFGFIGLYETCQFLIGESNTTTKGRKLSKEILTHINNLLDVWKAEDHLNYSLYGTPEENLTYKAATALRRDFGLIEHITDKDYVVNSYHVDPREPIDAFKKLEIEGEYLALCPGGAVSYVETADLRNNTKAIETTMRYMYDHIAYAEFNRLMGHCYSCGFDGVIPLTKTEDGKFQFKCPSCGETHDENLHVDGRICGYLGQLNAGNTNKGRLADVFARVIHLQ